MRNSQKSKENSLQIFSGRHIKGVKNPTDINLDFSGKKICKNYELDYFLKTDYWVRENKSCISCAKNNFCS